MLYRSLIRTFAVTLRAMNENKRLDAGSVRAFGMNWGTVVGILCSFSFLCSMYGLQYSSLGLLSNLLGVAAVIVAGNGIRKFRWEVGNITFGQACRMAISIYFYAILLTAMVQYIYFAYLDHGRLIAQMQTILSIPEYRQWMEQMANGEDVDTLVKTTMSVLQKPAQAAMQLLWMNCIVALLLTPITALIGVTGKKKAERQE